MESGRVLKTTVIVCLFATSFFSSASGQCSSTLQLDIVFILDASGSVGSSNFQTMLAFVQNFIDGFEIGSNKVRIGVQKYSTGTNTEFNLRDDYVKSSVKNRVANVVYTGGSTNTGVALQYVRTTMFTPANGDRAGVTNICILLTDGVSNSYSDTATQAANARNAGIVIYAIGIGSGIPVAELNEVATDPDADHVFSVSSFGALNTIISSFQSSVCPPVNGGWSSWSSWGTCSVTCNVGSHSRSRSCTNPSPANGGSYCGGHSSEVQSCDVGPSVDGCVYSNSQCVSCNPGYSWSGSNCDWCKTNFTGCSCQNCQTNHIGYNSDCGVLCYNGDPDVPGGRICDCYADTTRGFWAGSSCNHCLTGWMSPLCTSCDTHYVGPNHCTIYCIWGQGYHVYKNDGNWGTDPLTPTFDCVIDNNDGTYTGYFGYINSNNHNLYLSAGNSYLTGTTGTLPTKFRPGTFNYVFSTARFPIGSAVSWTLGYPKSNTVFTVSVPSNPTLCYSPPTSTIPTGATQVVDPGHCHCMPGYYGASCQSACPGGAGNPCYGNGVCDQSTGACSCDGNFNPATSCQTCKSLWTGTDCSLALPPSVRQTPGSKYVAKVIPDGGFITFDGTAYTFNGLGEFKLWSSRTGMTGQLTVHGRFALTSSNGLATSLDAIAVKSDNSVIELYCGTAESSRDAIVFSSAEEGPAFVTSSAGAMTQSVSYQRMASDHYRIFMSPRYTLDVYARGRSLELTIQSDAYSCYQSLGLLQNCDGTNSLKDAAGNTYSYAALNKQVIHQTFAPTYAFSGGSSLFSYNRYVYPQLSGGNMCFDRTYMISEPVSTFSNSDVTLEVKINLWSTHSGCGVLFSYRMDTVFTVLVCSTSFQLYEPSLGTVTVPSITLTPDTWYHLAFVWTSSNENLRVLRYDTSSGSQAANVGLSALSVNPFRPGGTFWLGRYNSPVSAPEKLHWGLSACLDDFRIWDAALSDSNVNSRAWTYILKETTSLSSIWRFDEGEGMYAVDPLSDTKLEMYTETPWTRPQWSKSSYGLSALTYSSAYPLTYNYTGANVRDQSLHSSISSFCTSLITTHLAGSYSTLGSGHQQFFLQQCVFSGVMHRSQDKVLEVMLPYIEYLETVTGTSTGDLQNLCGQFPGRTYPYFSGAPCNRLCQSGKLEDGQCVCEEGYWGDFCNQTCPQTTNGACNGFGLCDPDDGQCVCPHNFDSSSSGCSSCVSGWVGDDCSFSTLARRHNGSYYMCSAYEGGHFITLDGLSYYGPQSGEFKMMSVPELDLYVRQVGCKRDQFCITGVWAVVGTANVAIHAPLATWRDAYVQVNGGSVTVDSTYSLGAGVSLERYSPDLFLLHYRNRYDVFIRVFDHRLHVQALVKSSYCNVDTGLCGRCNNDVADDLKDANGDAVNYIIGSTENIVNQVMTANEVPLSTNTFFIYQTTYTEPRVVPGDGYCIYLNQTTVQSQHVNIFTEDIITFDFQVKPATANVGTVIGFTSDEMVSISAENTYKLKINGTAYDSGVPVVAGEWNHVTMTYFRTNGTILVYVDTETADSQQGSTSIPDTIFNSPGVLSIGGLTPRPGESVSSVNPPLFQGEFDSFRIWNRTFDRIMVKQNSYHNVNTTFGDLIAQWTFSEGQGGIAEDEVQGIKMYVPRPDTAQWRLSSPTMNTMNGLAVQRARRRIRLSEQLTYNATTSTLLYRINATEAYCQDLIYNSQVHSLCSGSLGANVATFFYDRCRTANLHTDNSRSYSVQALVDYAEHCQRLVNLGTDPVQTVCDSHCLMVEGSICLGCAFGSGISTSTCRFGTVNATTSNCDCDPGYWGTQCSQACPGGASTPCSNQGTCNVDTGACVCYGHFSGASCSSCASGWSGSTCSVLPANPSDPWLSAQERVCSFSVAGSLLSFGGKMFDYGETGDFYFLQYFDAQLGTQMSVQGRLVQCPSGQICLIAIGFQDLASSELTVELDPISNMILVTANDVLQAPNVNQLSVGTMMLTYLSTFSLQVNESTTGLNAVISIVDSRLSLVLRVPTAYMGSSSSLCGDGTVDPADLTIPDPVTVTIPGSELTFNSTTTTAITTTNAAAVTSTITYGTTGGSILLNQTFLSSDPTSGLFSPTSPGTVEVLTRPYQDQGVLFSYGYNSAFSVFLNGTVKFMLGEDVYDSGFQIPTGEWTQISVAWDPATMEFKVIVAANATEIREMRIVVNDMSCLEDGGVISIGKWTQPNTNASHPPTSTSYLGELDEVRLWSQDLSVSDVQAGFQQPVDLTDPTLVARWTFDEGQGSVANDFRGTHLYVTDHLQAGTPPQWMLSDAPVAYTTPTTATATPPSWRTTAFLQQAEDLCSSVVGNFTTSNCPGVSATVKAFYQASCLDLILQTGNLTKAAEIAASLVALCHLGSSSSSSPSVADYWCDPYAGNYVIGTGATCSSGSCLFPNTTLSSQTACVCATGYWGTSCDGSCPGGASNTCSHHGVCDALQGTCVCQVNWNGAADCSSCTAGWVGADCSVSYLSTTGHAICSAATNGRFTTFDGSSAQYTSPGAYSLYQETSGPSVLLEQAPCSTMHACVYRVILTHSGHILVFDLSEPGQGLKVVNSGVDTQVFTQTTLANGLVLTHPTSTKWVVRTSGSDFNLEVRLTEAYLTVDLLVDKTRCAAVTGLCGPCQPQSTSSCAPSDAVCLIQQLGIQNASTHTTVSSAQTAQFIVAQMVNVTVTELGYPGGSPTYTSTTTQVESTAGRSLYVEGEGASTNPLPPSSVDTNKNVTLEAVILVEQAEGCVLSYAGDLGFSININAGVFEVQCDNQTENTGIQASVGNWSHVSVVYDPVSGRTLFHYVNSDGLPSYKVLTLPTTCFDDQGTLAVGQWQLARNNTGTKPAGNFQGQVDRVALWNRRFGPQDILNHWEEDLDPTGEPDLVAYWNFNEGQGDTAYDAVQGIPLTLPSPLPSGASQWPISTAPIHSTIYTTHQHTTGITSALNPHQQLAVTTCHSLFNSGPLHSACGLLAERANYYYVSCVNDVTQARDADYAMDSVLQFASECQTTLGLGSWPAQSLCNNFTSRAFPTWYGPTCSLRCDFGTYSSVLDVCQCFAGYWGTSCDSLCPPGNGLGCHGHGTCDQATGTCACELQWKGDSSCGSCSAGWTGSECNIMAPSSGSRPPTMCTVDRGGFLLTHELYGITLDKPSAYILLDMTNLQVQVTQMACSVGLCVHGVAINYHDRTLAVLLDTQSLLQLHVDGSLQGRGVSQTLTPTGVTGCPLTVAWVSNRILQVELAPLGFKLLVSAVGSSLSVMVKEMDATACCGGRMTGLCGSCGTCSAPFNDTCQLTSASPAPAPTTPSATSCSVAITGSMDQSTVMQNVQCTEVGPSNDLFEALLNTTAILGVARGFYEPYEAPGEGICFDKSSALVKNFQQLTTNQVTVEFLLKTCTTSNCHGTLISFTHSKTFSIRHGTQVDVTYGSDIWSTNFALEDRAWNQISLVFDKVTFELDLYYFDSTGLAGRFHEQMSEDVLPNDGFLGIGRWQPSPDPADILHGPETFKGCIDHFRVWNRTFNNIEIQNHWNVTYNGTEDNLAALWKFDHNRNGFTYDVIHDVEMLVPPVPFPPGEIDYSDAPIPFKDVSRRFPHPVAYAFAGRRKRSVVSRLPLSDIITACQHIFTSSDLAQSCTAVGTQMTEKYFFDCLSDMYYGEDLTDALPSTLAYADYCHLTLNLTSWPARTLCNYFPHNAGFPNWIGDNCDVECVSGFRHPNDNNTCVCDHGFYGANCSMLCPGGTENACSGFGTCEVLTGTCPCPVSRRGSADCSTCQGGWEGSECVLTSSPSSSFTLPVAKVSDLGHILNLDGVGFGFQGTGEYHLLQLRPNIVLQGKFIMCHQNFSCLSFLGMRVGTNGDGYAKITVQAPYLTTSEPPVYVNGALNTVRKVTYFKNFEIRRVSLHELVLDVYNTVQVTIRARKRLLDVTVTVPASNVPASVGLLAGSGSTVWSTKSDYIADHSRISSSINICGSGASTQSPRSSQYSSGTMSLPTSSVLSSPASGHSVTLDNYFARFVVSACDSVLHYPSAAFSDQQSDGYTLKFDNTGVFSKFSTSTLMASNLSVEVLVKVDSTGSGGDILSFANSVLFNMRVNSNWYLIISHNNTDYNSGLQLERNVWNKILFVYESVVGEVNVYTFNQHGAIRRAVLTMPTGIFETEGRLTLGQALPPDDGVYYITTSTFKGEIDNFRLWKILIEPTMVIDVSDLGMSLTDYTIRAAWTFDEAEDDDAYDLIQGAILALPVRPWGAPTWTASDKTNTLQVTTSPLVHYFVNKTLETDAESLCSSLVAAVANLAACASLSAGTQSFYHMQCLQQVAKASSLAAAYLAMFDLGDVCYRQLGAASWPLSAYCTGNARRGTDCVAGCVFGEWDGSSCTCYEGFSGTTCNSACPAANSLPCNGHGTCSSGTCVCDHNWQGSDCTSCASGWTGTECTFHYGPKLTNNPRTGFLSATGEVLTFDGASFTFSGVSGVYRVVQDPSDGLYVQAHTVYCEFGTCVDAIGVQMFSFKVTVYAPSRDYALPKVKVGGSEVNITGTEHVVHTHFRIQVLTRNSLKLAISSPYQCDVTVTSAGRFLQTGVHVNSYLCSSSTGLMGRCDGSNSNDLHYTATSYSQSTLVNLLNSQYSVNIASSVFSHDVATEFNSVVSHSKAGFVIGLDGSAVQSDRLTYNLAANQSFTLFFSYRPTNVEGAILTYSRNSTFVIANTNPISIQIGATTHVTPASSSLNEWNHVLLGVDRENQEVEFFHSKMDPGQGLDTVSYKKLPLGAHEFLEPGGWLTLGQLQVSIDERPYTLWDGQNMYTGDIGDVVMLNGMLPHIMVRQALSLHADILAFASADVLYNYRLMEGTSYKVADATGTTDMHFAYAPWQTTPWELSDEVIFELPPRSEDTWKRAVDYDKRTRETTASSLCNGFFQHSSVTTSCSGVDADFRNQLQKQCYDSYVATGLREAVLHSMIALADVCSYVATVDVKPTTLCNSQFENVTWVELRCTGCQHGYKIADGTCQCYPGYWDADCSGTCPGGVDTPCSLHGACNKDGSCTCLINWDGAADCSACTSGWTGSDCNTMVGDYISGPYTTAVAQIRSQTWVTTFDGNTFYLNSHDTYLLLRVHSTNFYVYGRQTTCGTMPKTFTCFDAFMVRHGSDYYFADWTHQDEHALTLKTPSGDIQVLTKRTFGTLTVTRSSLNSFQFQESVADILLDITSYDHGPHITMQLFRKTDLRALTLSGLLASCDTQFAARASPCSGLTLCNGNNPNPSISHCQTSLSSTSFATLATQAISTEKTQFNALAGLAPSHVVSEYMLFMNRTGLVTAENLTLSATVPTTFEVIYKPVGHGGVVFSYGDAVNNVALVDNDTSLFIVYKNKVVALNQTSVLTEWSQVDLVWDPIDSHLELFLTDYQHNVATVRTQLDSDAFLSGGRASLGELLPGAALSTNDHLVRFVGYMGELRVYTRPHNPTVITQNAFIAVSENSPDLQHAWNFDVNEGDYFVDLKYLVYMIATNVTETPLWDVGDYTLNVKDGATSYWVTLPRSDPFETLATQKCQNWFSNATLMGNCQLGDAFIDTYKKQCFEDQVARRNHSEGMKSVLQFAEFCRRLEVQGSSAVPPTGAVLVHNASELCQEFPEATFQGYWDADCQSRCLFGHMVDTECHCTFPYWGPGCDMACPVSDFPTYTAVCDNHGHCRKTDGFCVCQSRWTGVAYNFTLYPYGYVDPSSDYACTSCSDGWYGTDCSTALLQRPVNGSDGYAFISSSVVVTLDGASAEISKTGAYRLLTSTNMTVDGYFKQCQGRYDCRALQEVSIDYNGDLVSVSLKDNGYFEIHRLLADYDWYFERHAPTFDNKGGILVYCLYKTFCRVTIDEGIELVVQAFYGEMFAGFIVSRNLTNVSQGGLLGNFDGHWLNDFYTGGLSDNYYIANNLSALTKASEADANHLVSSATTVLNNTDLGAHVVSTGGYLLKTNNSHATATFNNPDLNTTDEFTVEMWIYIDQDTGHAYDLFTFSTEYGDFKLSVDNGHLRVDWQKSYNSTVTVPAKTWSRVAVTWRDSDGLLYLYCLDSQGAGTMDMEWGFPYGQNVTFTTMSFLGAATNAISLDYVRVWSIVRGMSDLQSDLSTYDTTMHHGVEFVALFDEGHGTRTHALMVKNDTVLVVYGDLANVEWAESQIPTSLVVAPADLPAIVNQTDAVDACLEEFSKSFSAYCPDFGSIRQLLVELCISDVIRFNDTNMKKMAASVFVFYCQAVTQEAECYFKGYLDFCPDEEDPSMLPLILGIVFGVLGCCSCCTLLGLLRKKIFGDGEEKPPEKPKPPQDGENGPNKKKDFEEKEFTGGDLPPDAVPPVPPPSTNMYNYLAKMDGVDADNQDLFTKYNRSPSVNSIAVSLQSYGIGSGSGVTSPTLPTSPSRASLGQINEEYGEQPLSARSAITPVDLPR